MPYEAAHNEREQMKPHQLRSFSFPEYWHPILETINSPEQALERLRAIDNFHISKEGEGISAFLINDKSESIHVLLGKDRWALIYHDGKDRYLVSLGSDETDRRPFLFPEWTEIEMKHLIPVATAQKVLSVWLESGSLSDDIKWEE